MIQRGDFPDSRVPLVSPAVSDSPPLQSVISREAPLPDFDLDWLLAPLSPARWLAEYHERQPLVIQRRDPEYYASFFTMDDLDRLLTGRDWSWPAVRLVKDGYYVPAEKWPARREGSLIDRLLTEYQRGTILVLEPKQFCEPIAALARTFESLLSYRFGASIWLTPKGAGPSRFHYDVENVLVMQISGSKLWRIYEAAVPFPSEHMTYSSNLTPGKLLYEVALRPGDLLYFPRGFGHEVIPSHDEHSLHVGFACLVPTAFHVIRDALHELARRDARLRQALPPGFARPGGAQRAVELVRATATALWDDLDLEGAVSQLGRRFVQHAAPLLRGAFAQASAPPAVTLDSRVRRRPHVLWRMEQQGELLCLSFHGKVLRMPREGEPALRFIVESTDFTVASLPGDLGDDEKLEFVQTLLDAGFLMPPRDASAEKLVAAVNSHGVAGRF